MVRRWVIFLLWDHPLSPGSQQEASGPPLTSLGPSVLTGKVASAEDYLFNEGGQQICPLLPKDVYILISEWALQMELS